MGSCQTPICNDNNCFCDCSGCDDTYCTCMCHFLDDKEMDK